jgi:hypothetical protein
LVGTVSEGLRVNNILKASAIAFLLTAGSQINTYAAQSEIVVKKVLDVREFSFRITESGSVLDSSEGEIEEGLLSFQFTISAPPSRDSLPYGGKLLGNYIGPTVLITERIPNAAFQILGDSNRFDTYQAGFIRSIYSIKDDGSDIEWLPIVNTGDVGYKCEGLVYCPGDTFLPEPTFADSKRLTWKSGYSNITATYSPLGTEADYVAAPYAYTGTFYVTFEIGHAYEVLDSSTLARKKIGLGILKTYQEQQAIHEDVKAMVQMASLGRALKEAGADGAIEVVREWGNGLIQDEAWSGFQKANVDAGGGRSYSSFFGEFSRSIVDQLIDFGSRTADKLNPLKAVEVALLIPEAVHAMWGAAGQWLVNDPADPNFKEIFDVYSSFDYQAFQSGDESLDAYIQNSLLSAASVAGMVVANERYLGAVEAGDLEWATRQFDETDRNYELSVAFAKAADQAMSELLAKYGEEFLFDSGLPVAGTVSELKLLLQSEALSPEQKAAIESLLARVEGFEFDTSLTFQDAFAPVSGMHNIVLASAVPEPKTYAMMAAGLLILAAWSRKRKAH